MNTIIKIARKLKMEDKELETSIALIVEDMVEYVPKSVIILSIIKKTTGHVKAMSFDAGERMTERTLPFDTFVQIIDGRAEIVINAVSNILNTGQSIIVPAHSAYFLKANERFKMILTIIKCGYE